VSAESRPGRQTAPGNRLKTALHRQVGHQLDQISRTGLIERVDELAAHNQHLPTAVWVRAVCGWIWARGLSRGRRRGALVGEDLGAGFGFSGR
jgi:hypothetical protein